MRWRPTAAHAIRWSRRSASSRAPTCARSSTRSSTTIPRSIRSATRRSPRSRADTASRPPRSRRSSTAVTATRARLAARRRNGRRRPAPGAPRTDVPSCAPPRTISPATCSCAGRSRSPMTTCRPRRSVPTWASAPSTPRTRGTSSAASGSWPSSSRGWSAHRCSPSSARPGAASRRRCAPGCCRRSRAARSPARSAGRCGSSAPASIRGPRRPTCSSSTSSRRSSRSAATPASGRPSSTRWWMHGGQVVLAVRADFYGHCAAHERLARLAGAHQVLVGPMRRDELRRAIECPAERAGLRVEPALTDALIGDVLDEPGGLPLLSAALLEQWRERHGRVMCHAAYERTGGVRGAVGRMAERTYAQLSEPEQRAARRTLLRLAGDGDVRRRVPRRRAGRAHAGRAHGQPAGDRGRGHGRGRARGAAARVAAPARVARRRRARPPPAPAPDRDGARVGGRRPRAGRALPGSAADGGARVGRRPPRTTSTGSSASSWTPAAPTPSARPRRSGAPTAACARWSRASPSCSPLALGAGVIALHQRGEAQRAALAADADRLGADALNEDRLDRALLLARHGVALDDSAVTRSNLLAVLLRNPAVLGEVDTGWNMFAVALSPDGRQMALGDERGNLSVYDAKTRLPAGRPYWIQGGLIQSVSFSPDGRTLARRLAQPVASGPPARRRDRSAQRPPPAADRAPRGPQARSVRVRPRPVRWRLAGRAGRGPRRRRGRCSTASTPPAARSRAG